MELWIRSQDRTKLIKVSWLNLYENDFIEKNAIYYTIEDDGTDLGTYKTKECALNVLNEIQKIIGWLQRDMKDVTLGDYYRLIGNFDDGVYEMPKEV